MSQVITAIFGNTIIVFFKQQTFFSNKYNLLTLKNIINRMIQQV